MIGLWRDASTVGDDHGLCLVWTKLVMTGEDLGYDLAWKEDGDWMLVSQDNEPSPIIAVAYVTDLLPKPTKEASSHEQPVPAPRHSPSTR